MRFSDEGVYHKNNMGTLICYASTEGRGEQRCLSLSHLWQRPAARGFDKLVGIFLATSDEKSKLLPVVLFLDVYSDCYE